MRWDEKYKHDLADKLAPQISREGLTDVTDWIEKNAEIKNGEDFRNNITELPEAFHTFWNLGAILRLKNYKTKAGFM